MNNFFISPTDEDNLKRYLTQKKEVAIYTYVYIGRYNQTINKYEVIL